MFGYLEKFFDQLLCEHVWELTYTEYYNEDDIHYHYICMNCGKTKILNRPRKK